MRTAPRPAPAYAAPPWSLLGLEPVRALMEFMSAGLMDRSRLPAGDGHPVVLFPGLGADQMAVAPLRRCCLQLGYEALDWGRGCNVGPVGAVEDWFDQLADGVEEIVAARGRCASLVGWSLGGIYAREIARRRPRLVRQVITLGTPFAGSGEHTNVGVLYQLLSGRTPVLDAALRARLAAALPVPSTSIYSRSDGLVAWQACLQQAPPSQQAENVEVEASHFGLASHPQVWAVIADRLAQPEGGWRPFGLRRPAAPA